MLLTLAVLHQKACLKLYVAKDTGMELRRSPSATTGSKKGTPTPNKASTCSKTSLDPDHPRDHTCGDSLGRDLHGDSFHDALCHHGAVAADCVSVFCFCDCDASAPFSNGSQMTISHCCCHCALFPYGAPSLNRRGPHRSHCGRHSRPFGKHDFSCDAHRYFINSSGLS